MRNFFIALVFGLVVALAAWQSDTIRALSAENEKLAADADKAEQDRSDFEFGMNANAALVDKCQRRQFTGADGYSF